MIGEDDGNSQRLNQTRHPKRKDKRKKIGVKYVKGHLIDIFDTFKLIHMSFNIFDHYLFSAIKTKLKVCWISTDSADLQSRIAYSMHEHVHVCRQGSQFTFIMIGQ